MTRFMDNCKAFLLDIIFPNRCPFCSRFIPWNSLICPECDKNITKANDIICRKCGNKHCSCSERKYFDAVFASFFYKNDAVRRSVMRLKLEGDTNIARIAAEDIILHMKNENIPEPDIIVPVPMGRKKRRRRGFNQAKLFADCIGKRLDKPVADNILYKYDNKDEQHNCSREERIRRVYNLFYPGNADLSGMTVLICDDIMTTGATLNRCSELLKELGAAKVIAAVCAVTEYGTG